MLLPSGFCDTCYGIDSATLGYGECPTCHGVGRLVDVERVRELEDEVSGLNWEIHRLQRELDRAEETAEDLEEEVERLKAVAKKKATA